MFFKGLVDGEMVFLIGFGHGFSRMLNAGFSSILATGPSTVAGTKKWLLMAFANF